MKTTIRDLKEILKENWEDIIFFIISGTIMLIIMKLLGPYMDFSHLY